MRLEKFRTLKKLVRRTLVLKYVTVSNKSDHKYDQKIFFHFFLLILCTKISEIEWEWFQVTKLKIERIIVIWRQWGQKKNKK